MVTSERAREEEREEGEDEGVPGSGYTSDVKEVAVDLCAHWVRGIASIDASVILVH